MAIITISHELGGGGPEIGNGVARRLGYRYVDQELISEAARRYGLVEEKLSHLGENKPSFFERLDAETRRYIVVTQATMYELAEDDNVVLVGRGGQWLLRGVPHVLRVRVTAPFEVRVRRLVERLPAEVGESADRRAVAEMVRRDDTGKAGRMRYLYDVDLRDPALYDLVINTEKLTVEAAVEALAGLARSAAVAPTDASRRLVSDRALAARVEVALATHEETRGHRYTVEASEGVVTLESTTAADRAAEVAGEVPGVREVRTREVEIPPIPPFVA